MIRTNSSKLDSTIITPKSSETPISVLIIGAGFAGLGAAIRLLEAGVKDIVMLERSTEVGGTWRDNSYPGAACDIPSNLYSYSFAQNPAWSRGFSGSKEILGYIHYLVERFQLARFIRFNHTVTDLVFDEAQGIWQVNTKDGQTLRARTVVMAQGPLSNASFPKIDGIDSFKGKKIHSAQWDHSYDFRGKRVAVIGTGASAIQIIPELVKEVSVLKVFQRTASWVMPRPDYATPDWNKALFTKIPAAQNIFRKALYLMHESMALGVVWNSPLTAVFEGIGRRYLRHQVKDSWMRRQLMPDYRLGCKRILVSNDYYPALQQKNCQLITWPIAKIAPDGIRTAEGLEHQVDCIVFATGFEIAKSGAPFPITGLNGRQLNDEWSRGAKAYKSVSVAGYPNLFLTFGPNSGPGHNSALVYMESQIDYLVKGIQTVLQAQVKFMDVRADVQSRYNASIQKRLTKTNWNTGCKSWYLTKDGYNSTMYPGFATQFKRQMQTFELADYQMVSA
jgi:cation diffusion facilitator CzcD-associated flavoprotein CzcO